MKTRMSALVVLMMLALSCVAVLGVAGCGNVSLQGDAMATALTSALNAYQASQRADKDAAAPDWMKAYLSENFKQWRCFVQSAKKDTNWGPKLPSEQAVPAPSGSK